MVIKRNVLGLATALCMLGGAVAAASPARGVVESADGRVGDERRLEASSDRMLELHAFSDR